MDADIEDYIHSCLAYQHYKSLHITTIGELVPILIPDKSWNSIALNIIIDLSILRSKVDFNSEVKENILLYLVYNTIFNITCRIIKEAKFLLYKKNIILI